MIVHIINKEDESSNDDEDSDDKNRQTKIFHTDRLKAIESVIEYREQEEESWPSILWSLKNGEKLLQENAKVI